MLLVNILVIGQSRFKFSNFLKEILIKKEFVASLSHDQPINFCKQSHDTMQVYNMTNLYNLLTVT